MKVTINRLIIIIKMINQQDNNVNTIREENYLITHAIDPSTIPQQKKQNDLYLLNKAEQKRMHKSIARGIQSTQMETAVSALKLENPFKGY